MKKGCIYSFVVMLSVAAYVYFADRVTVAYNKIDTLYMVSTIFYSAVIGMVISNNVHLGNARYRNEIRKYYRAKRNALTFFFHINHCVIFRFGHFVLSEFNKTFGCEFALIGFMHYHFVYNL